MTQELAKYIADYINEEINRLLAQTYSGRYTSLNVIVKAETILNAIEAYEGGAR